MYAQVVLPLSRYQSFTYEVPSDLVGLLRAGSFVHVPFRTREAIGVVVSLEKTTSFPGKTKPISAVVDGLASLPEDLWSTLEWIADYTMTPLGMVIKTALPLGFSEPVKPREQLMIAITDEGRFALESWTRRAPVQLAIITELAGESDPIPLAEMTSRYPSAPAAVKKLTLDGLVERTRQSMSANPLEGQTALSPTKVKLNDEQTTALEEIQAGQASARFAPFLLRGVTSSGKTEVYLQAAREMLEAGRSVLVLVPEIVLTPQVADRFHAAFGEKVALWHSKMTQAEKAWTWQQLLEGRFRVVVGARSAIFSPLTNLGLIIVDEEQEGSYKQDDPAPRYHARDVALVRGRDANAVVLMTTATPSVESYYNALTGLFKPLILSQRYGGATYPKVQLVDLRLERQQTDRYNIILSRSLLSAIADRLERKEQVILLQNRRGFAPICACSDCDYVADCPNCSVPLTFHKHDGILKCHYCDHRADGPDLCPTCGSPHIYVHGIGTEQVEEALEREFPLAAVARMDADTTKGRGAHKSILSDFEAGRYDILLGTQMIAKGLDFDNVTLVGIINADTGLAFPDFRAGERTFQLVYQVCGRSGRRKERPGEAIIQTNHPDDLYIQAAARLDPHRFYNLVLAERKELNYPPFSRQIRLLLQGVDRTAVWNRAVEVRKKLTPLPDGMSLLGPASAPFERLRGRWRTHLLLRTDRSRDGSGSYLRYHLRTNLPQNWLESEHQGVRLIIDVDPINLL